MAEGRGLHPLQQAFVEAGAVQCGFCTPGLMLATLDLLSRHPRPGREEIREGLSEICAGARGTRRSWMRWKGSGSRRRGRAPSSAR